MQIQELVGREPMRLKRARTLAVSFDGDTPLVHNFLTRQVFTCSAQAIDLLARLDDWHDAQAIFDLMPDVSHASLAEQLAQLLQAGGLVVEGSREAQAQADYDRLWPWDNFTGFYHFSTREANYVHGEELEELKASRHQGPESPALLTTNEGLDVSRLPPPRLSEEPMRLMRSRRSRRTFAAARLALEDLSDCLFAGLGVTDIYREHEFGPLPFTMTPSGGARNPYELFIYAPRVEGLAPGIYHYSGLDHDLGLVKSGLLDLPGLLAGQQWIADAAAVVFLVAHFERSAWKYRQPGAYRIVQVEAGCIAQNILLTATARGLASAPTGAMYEQDVERALGLSGRVNQAVSFAIALGLPAAQEKGAAARVTPHHPRRT